MAEASPLTANILDNGSQHVKLGFGGETAPREEWDNVVGSARHAGVNGIMLGLGTDSFVGPDAVAQRGLLKQTWPVDRGFVRDWDAMALMWQRAYFGGLNVACEEHPLLVTGVPDETREDKEKKAQILFETLSVPAIVLANTSTLSLYSTGRTSGLVVDSGAGRTHIGPVWEGYCQPHFLRRLDLAGRDVTEHLCQKLRADGYPISTESDRAVANAIKESLCYVTDDMARDAAYCRESKALERLFALPDGQQIFMNEHRFTVPEALFRNELLGSGGNAAAMGGGGIHRVIHETISCADPLIQPELYGSVVLAGGNTLFPKLEDRIQREIAAVAPKGVAVKVVAFPERKYAAWLGGSILGSLSTFPCMWVSKNEYDDYGPTVVHRKCGL